MKNWLTGKDPDTGKDWRKEEGMTEGEMVGWHHWQDGHEFKQAPGVGDGQGSLACCSPWDRKELDTTEQLNWTERSSLPTVNVRVIVTGSFPLRLLLYKSPKALGAEWVVLFGVLITNYHLPSTSIQIKSRAAAVDFQHPLKGVQGGEQKWGTLCFEKNLQHRSSDRHFQELFLLAQFLYLLTSRKAPIPFMVTSAPCD